MYYVVMLRSFEYNDEYMYTPESGGGNPVSVHTNEKEARDAMLNLERQIWRGNEYDYYMSEGSNLPSDFDEKFLEIFGEPKYQIPEDATDEQMDKFIALIDESQYYIEEVK